MTVEQLAQPAPGGSGTYITELAAQLAKDQEVSLLGVAARRDQPLTGLPHEVLVRHGRLPRPVQYEAWNRFRPRGKNRALVAAQQDRVLHATTWAVPPRTAPLVVTVHDLAFLRDPSHFTRRGNAFFRRALTIVRAEADVVVVPSAVTARDCVAHGIDEARIHVIHHGVRVPLIGEHDVEGFRREHGLARPYLLWCGTLEPRKNLEALVSAFEQLLAEDDPGLDLVLVGPLGWGDVAARVAAHAEQLGGRVHLLGRLSHHDLHVAYAGARAFCFPSTWEGFGMPVLEAMAHGVPVVTSSGTSMAEVVGDGALLVDPRSTRELAEAMRAAAGAKHGELAVNALANAARYSWARSATAHVAAYRDAVERTLTSGGRR